MAQIYRIGNDIYDATTNQRIANPQVLQTQYRGATEVAAPGMGSTNTSNADSTSIIRPGQYGMSDWKGYQALKDAANEVIKIRQAGNQDIINPTTFWKTAMANSNDVTDKRLNELSPGDQATLRLSKQGTANAALSSLEEERKYRESVAGDTMSNVKDIYESQRQATKDANDKAYQDAQLEIARYEAGMGGGGNQSGGGIIVDPTGNAYDISSYATDPAHEKKVASILASIPQLKNQGDIDVQLQSMVKTTPITGKMIMDSAAKYGVSWEAMIAMMMQDSSLGTAGKAVRTNNPGNVGNTDSGGTQTFKTLEEGVDAVARWLSNHKADASAQPTGEKNNNLTPSQMRALAVDTGIDVALIPQMTQQEVVNAQVKANSTSVTAQEELANTLEGKKIGVTYGLSTEDLKYLFTLISGGLTPEERNQIIALGVPSAAIDAAIALSSPNGGTTSTLGVSSSAPSTPVSTERKKFLGIF